MKVKQIVLALAGLSMSAAAFAAPVTVAEIDAAFANNTLQQAWISGATAPTRSIYEGWVGSGTGVGCDVGTNTIFTNQATTSNATVPGSLGNFVAYACKRAGRVSVLYHTLDGGSLNAYTPHTVGTKLARVKYVGTGNGCSTTTFSYTDATNTENNATIFKGCTLVGAALPGTGATSASNASNAAAVAADNKAPQLPVGGFSDVEAALFPATIGGGDVSSKGTESNAFVGQVFGVAVSKPLYRALQVAQGIANNTDALDPNYDPVNAPNLSKVQVATIIGQSGAANGDWTPILGNNPGKVKVERRVSTSGTQASSNAFFLASPCAAGISGDLVPASAADSVAGAYEVTENSGSGNVKTRITTAANSATAAERYAIGVLSTENDWRAENAANNGYRFVKVEGVHPEAGDTANARVAAANGQYPFHMEMKNFVRNGATGFEAGVVPAITAALASPPSTASCNVLPRGLTLNPLGGSICSVGTIVSKSTNFGNNCKPAQLTQ